MNPRHHSLSENEWHSLLMAANCAKQWLRLRWRKFRYCIDDAVHEAILSMAEAITYGRKNFPQSTQELIKALSTEASKFIRREARQWCRETPSPLLEMVECNEVVPPPTHNPDSSIAAIMDVHNALSQLPALLKEAVILVEIEDKSIADAARISGCSVNTMKQRVFRGRERLRLLLNDYRPSLAISETRWGGGRQLYYSH